MSYVIKKVAIGNSVLRVVFLLLLLYLIAYPPKVIAYFQIEHEGHSSSVQSSRIEHSSPAQREVERAHQGVNDANIPSSPLYSTTRQYNILRAESELDRANNDVRDESNRLYWQNRIQESNNREQKIKKERKEYPQAKGHSHADRHLHKKHQLNPKLSPDSHR
jgi:hypothetical protein